MNDFSYPHILLGTIHSYQLDKRHVLYHERVDHQVTERAVMNACFNHAQELADLSSLLMAG